MYPVRVPYGFSCHDAIHLKRAELIDITIYGDESMTSKPLVSNWDTESAKPCIPW